MMTWQLVALATQLRKASGLLELDEPLDDAGHGPHMLIRAFLQLPLNLELELELELVPGMHVPHLAMMLSTACSHLDVLAGQPLTNRTDRTNPRKARFMSSPTK
jgi:hypothetical protein